MRCAAVVVPGWQRWEFSRYRTSNPESGPTEVVWVIPTMVDLRELDQIFGVFHR